MSEIRVTRTTPLYPSGVFLQWDIESDEAGPILVDVARSGAPTGPWETIKASLRNAYNALDDLQTPASRRRIGPNQLSLSRAIYYRVTATAPSGAMIESEPTPVEPHLDARTRLLKRKILRDQAIGYRRLNGIVLVVLKRRRWGDRCPVCYDALTKQATHEHCPTCLGTSFVGGYWSPIAIRGRREAATVQVNMASQGDAEQRVTDFNILDYPLVEAKDVIIDLARNDRYEIQRVHATELRGVPVHQKITAGLLSRSSVEYQVLVEPRSMPSLY